MTNWERPTRSLCRQRSRPAGKAPPYRTGAGGTPRPAGGASDQPSPWGKGHMAPVVIPTQPGQRALIDGLARQTSPTPRRATSPQSVSIRREAASTVGRSGCSTASAARRADISDPVQSALPVWHRSVTARGTDGSRRQIRRVTTHRTVRDGAQGSRPHNRRPRQGTRTRAGPRQSTGTTRHAFESLIRGTRGADHAPQG